MEIWIDSSKYGTYLGSLLGNNDGDAIGIIEFMEVGLIDGSLQICSRKVLMILGIKRIELYLKPQFEKQELIYLL